MNETIEELKAKYGRIITVTIPLDEEDHTKVLTLHLKKPDKQTRKMIAKLAESAIPERAVIAGYKALWVGGDDVTELERNDDALLSAESALIEILQVQKATIKKN